MDKPLAWVSIKMKTFKNLFYSQTTALKHWNTMNATDKVQICQLALHDDLIIVKEPLHLPSLTLGLLSFLS